MTTMRWMNVSVLVAVMVGVTACGSGGGGQEVLPVPGPVSRTPIDPLPSPMSTLPVGIWNGRTTGDGRITTGIILPDGKAWFIISITGAQDWAGAVVYGDMSAKAGETTWTMANTIMIDREFQTRATVQASGTVLQEQRLLGYFVNQYDPPSGSRPLNDTNGVDLIYDTKSRVPIELSKIAGEYLGLVAPYEEVLIAITENGSIEGRTALGCTFSGNAVESGPVAEITLTFEGPPCVQRGATVRGVLAVDLDQGRLVSAALSQDRNAAFLFIGLKQ